jgi:F0F1-type ATP synthase assembly protein I
MSETRKELFRLLGVYSQVGVTFVFCVFIGLGIGWYLDNKVFGGRTAPYLTFIFLGVGIFAGFKSLWEIFKRVSKE